MVKNSNLIVQSFLHRARFPRFIFGVPILTKVEILIIEITGCARTRAFIAAAYAICSLRALPL
jgi:hypothetical protein